MTKQIEAVYENGVLRPTQPINVPEGEHLHLIVVTREKTQSNGNAAELLAEMPHSRLKARTVPSLAATMTPFFTRRDHDLRGYQRLVRCRSSY